jgi:hypothetical protein
MVTEHDETDFSADDEGEMSSAFDEPSEKEEDERDEVKEVHKLAQKETARVRMGKLLVLVSILATAALVSTGTYIFLKKEEDADYNKSVRIPFFLHNAVNRDWESGTFSSVHFVVFII